MRDFSPADKLDTRAVVLNERAVNSGRFTECRRRAAARMAIVWIAIPKYNFRVQMFRVAQISNRRLVV